MLIRYLVATLRICFPTPVEVKDPGRFVLKQWFRRILPILVSAVMVACSNRPHHPPRFADFRRAFDLGMETEGAINKQVAVFQSGALTQSELSRVFMMAKPELMIGAATQAQLFDPLGLKLALRSTELAPTQPVGYASLSYKLITLIRNDAGERALHLEMFADAVRQWQALEPSNSVPRYLEASYFLFHTNTSRAGELIGLADSMESFETYEEPIRKCVVQAYRSAGYPHYSSLVLASGHSTGSLHLSVLGKEWLQATSSTPTSIAQAIKLGKRVATGRSMIAELVGLHLQLKALDHDPSKTFEKYRSACLGRRTYIQRASKYLSSSEVKDVSESRWIQFYETSSTQGEMVATEALARERGQSFELK